MPAAPFLNDPVSAHCRRDTTTLRPDQTVGEALTSMRAHPPGGRVIYFYVTDDSNKLLGVVPTRRLLLSPEAARIDSLMIRNVIAVPETATVLDACEFFTLHRLLAFPVIDAERKLVGVIDVDLYTSELVQEPESEVPRRPDDVFELIGVHLSTAAQANPWQAARGRFPWLVCNIAGGLVAAVLAGVYQDVLTWKDAVLALFIPIVLALAESVAIQSLTLTVSRLKAATTDRRSLMRQAVAEAGTGVILGAGAAILVAAAVAGWLGDFRVAVILLGAVGGGVILSAVVGFAVPTLLHRLKWNPQVAAGPVSLAAADMLTLLLYFNLARLAAGP